MIKVGKNKEISEVFSGHLPISFVYVGRLLVWGGGVEGTSCFSTGIWRDELNWVDDEIWADNIV